MIKKWLIHLFPWLPTVRKKQRKLCFYWGMAMDGRHYARNRSDNPLPCPLFETSCPLYNTQTGFDMKYQENKVFNLKLAAATMDSILIRPNETFSFWRLARYADRSAPYRDGLTVTDGKLTTAPGGGLCQLSNLLFWLFLHSPMTVVERHGHGVKDFPEPPSDAPMGVDATISEGWLDLKIRNDTAETYQVRIGFDADRITGRLYTDREDGIGYEIKNGQPLYYRQGGKVYEEVVIYQHVVAKASGRCIMSRPLYTNKCVIGYPLPADTQITEKG